MNNCDLSEGVEVSQKFQGPFARASGIKKIEGPQKVSHDQIWFL